MRCRDRSVRWLLAAGVIGAMLLAARGGDAGETKNPAATPSPRTKLDKETKKSAPDAGWMKRHKDFVAIAKKGHVDLLIDVYRTKRNVVERLRRDSRLRALVA